MMRCNGSSSGIGAPKYSFVCGQHGYKACVDDVYAIVARDELMSTEYSKHAHIHGVTAT